MNTGTKRIFVCVSAVQASQAMSVITAALTVPVRGKWIIAVLAKK
jgi:hypothetical protein